jgi:hypothetical protein
MNFSVKRAMRARWETKLNQTTTLKLHWPHLTLLIHFFIKGGLYDKKAVSDYRASDGCHVVNSWVHIINQ